MAGSRAEREYYAAARSPRAEEHPFGCSQSGWDRGTWAVPGELPCKPHLEMLGLERILTWHKMLGSRSGTSTRI